MKTGKSLLFLLIIFFSFATKSCEAKNNYQKPKEEIMKSEKSEVAIFGAGCFWCTEAVFQRVEGVESVVSGYTGGKTDNPTYQDISSGTTGHAEVCQITYNPDIVSFQELLRVFFLTHDPTTLNKQGADVGTQYRSAIFYTSEEQKNTANLVVDEINREGIYDSKIVTEITPEKMFYPAEKYHQNYYNENPRQGYCAFVITPKIEKFEKIFKNLMKR